MIWKKQFNEKDQQEVSACLNAALSHLQDACAIVRRRKVEPLGLGPTYDIRSEILRALKTLGMADTPPGWWHG